MDINRRDFVKLLGGSLFGLAVGSAAGSVLKLPNSAGPILYSGPRIESWKLTACTKCPGGCSLRIRLIDGLPMQAFGNPLSPINGGGICPLGLASVADLYHPSRLNGPVKKVNGKFKSISYDEAFGILSNNLKNIISDKKQDEVFIVAQTESKLRSDLFKTFSETTGFNNLIVDSFKETSALPFMKAAGEAPGFIDLDKCDYLLNFGSQMTEISQNPLYFTRKINEYRAKGFRITAVQPRLTPSISKLDDWIPLQPSQSGIFALGIAYILLKDEQYDKNFVEKNFAGFDEFKKFVLDNFVPDKVEKMIGIPSDKILETGRNFEKASAPAAYFDESVLYNSNGTQSAYAIIALNALKGFNGYGKIKANPFTADSKKEGKQIEAATFAKLNEQLSSSKGIQALIISGSNFVFNNSNPDALKKQLDAIPFIVSFSSFVDETSETAHLIIPDHCFLERLDLLTDVSIGAAAATVVQPVVDKPFFKTADTGDVIISLMKELKPDAKISYGNYSDYVKLTARKIYTGKEGILMNQSKPTVIEKGLKKIGWSTDQTGSFDDYWDSLMDAGGWWDPYSEKEPFNPKVEFKNLFDDKSFSTVSSLPQPKNKLRLNIFRKNLDYKGNMSIYPVLVEQFGNNWKAYYKLWVEINPETARSLSLTDRSKIILKTNKGKFSAFLVYNPAVMPGSLDVPFGLGHTVLGDTCGVNPLFYSENKFDPASGMPSYSETLVEIEGSQLRGAMMSGFGISGQKQYAEN